MPSHLATAKIRADQLGRRALIYVRQSTLMQVRENTASTARQYDLVQRALEWAGQENRSLSLTKTKASLVPLLLAGTDSSSWWLK